jgi:hypothetical protein
MRLARWSCTIGGALLVASGCVNSGAAGTTSSSGSGGVATAGSSGGLGGAGGGTVFVASGFRCSGATPGIAAAAAITGANCATGTTCHLAMQSASGMYGMLVDRIAEECLDDRMMIKPSDPEHSYVINKLTGKNLCASTPRMPLDEAPLSSADIQTIYDWICSGAPDQ